MTRLLLLLTLAACTSPDDTDPAADTDADTDTDSDSDTDADACDSRPFYAGCTALSVENNGSGESKTAMQWDGSGNLIATQQFDPTGTTVAWSTEMTYVSDRLVRYRASYASGPASDITYTYDAAGNLVESRDAITGLVHTFTYDADGREIGSTSDVGGDGTVEDTCTRTWSEGDSGERWHEECGEGVSRDAQLDARGLIATMTYQARDYWAEQDNTWRDDCQMEGAETRSTYGGSMWNATYDADHRQVTVQYQSATSQSDTEVTYTCD